MSTRIIVKNLPKKITEEEIKNHFSQKGVVTDVKIMHKEDGRSRNFCFVGFKTEQSAKDAIKYFNQTYLKTMKISVEKAKLQGDPSLKKKGKKIKNNNKNNEENENEEVETKDSKIKKILDLAKKTKNADKFDEALKNQNINNESKENEEIKAEDNNDVKEEKNENKEEKEKENNEQEKKDENKINKLINQKNLDPKRLYLRNIPFDITEDDIRQKFEKYGTINEIHIPINYKTNQSFGYAYISYETVESSIMAINKMDGEYFMGRRLHISIAEEKYSKPESELKVKYNQKDKSSYKKEKTTKLKTNYKDETNWNYLFLNQNAVIDTIAKRLKIKKEDLLSQNNPDIAVQISAMETTIINETKEWLKQQGINLDILKGKRQDCIRSKTIILVKNISNKTKKDTLQNLLERHGNLVRFLLSPSNTLAICEYVNKKHAENCIKHLSYYELDGEPLYLEFAPEGLVNESKDKKNINKNIEEEEKPKDIININESEDENDEDKKDEGINLVENQGKILFVKNLDFSTNEKQLKKFFEKKDYIVKKVEIAKHLKEGKNVSSGFGFVELKDENMVLKAMKNLQGALLGGHSLKLSISKSSSNENNMLQNKRKRETELNDYEYENENISNNKLLIKNIAFEANKEELRKLFKVYGQVKNLRLPTKIDGSHRGFAFIEFMSHEEAQKAFKELQNTHFYGRKIIIEWAKQDNSIEEIREKTSKKANAINIKTHDTKLKGTTYLKHK